LTPDSESDGDSDDLQMNAVEDVDMQFERASPIRAPKPVQTPKASQLARSSPRRGSPAKVASP